MENMVLLCYKISGKPLLYGCTVTFTNAALRLDCLQKGAFTKFPRIGRICWCQKENRGIRMKGRAINTTKVISCFTRPFRAHVGEGFISYRNLATTYFGLDTLNCLQVCRFGHTCNLAL